MIIKLTYLCAHARFSLAAHRREGAETSRLGNDYEYEEIRICSTESLTNLIFQSVSILSFRAPCACRKKRRRLWINVEMLFRQVSW